MRYSQGRCGRLAGEHRQHDCLRSQHEYRRHSHYHHYSKEGRGRWVSFRTPRLAAPGRSTCPLPGRSEFRIFLIMYFISLPFQLLTTGAVLQQGSTALVALTALHAGIVAGLFWALLGNAIVSTQVVEDGTLSSLIVRPPSALHSPSTRHVAHCSLFD